MREVDHKELWCSMLNMFCSDNDQEDNGVDIIKALKGKEEGKGGKWKVK